MPHYQSRLLPNDDCSSEIPIALIHDSVVNCFIQLIWFGQFPPLSTFSRCSSRALRILSKAQSPIHIRPPFSGFSITKRMASLSGSPRAPESGPPYPFLMATMLTFASLSPPTKFGNALFVDYPMVRESMSWKACLTAWRLYGDGSFSVLLR